MKKKIVFVILIVLILTGTGIVGFWVWKNNKIKTTNNLQNIQADKQVENNTNDDIQINSEPIEVDTSNWKTYRDEKYGFEIKYPGGWEMEEKIFHKRDIQNMPTPLRYISKEYQSGPLDRTDFYSILINAPFGYVSVTPFTLVVSDKFIEEIQCKYDSQAPCLNDGSSGFERMVIGGKEAYAKKDSSKMMVFLKNAPKKWGLFNEISLINYDYANLKAEENIKINKIFEEILKSVRFFEQ